MPRQYTPRTERTCQTCGTSFTATASQIRLRGAKYCCRACADIGRRSDPVCSIEGCDGETYSRNWCWAHYIRWWRYGDPQYVVPVDPSLHSTTQCPECGKEFTYLTSWPRKYCSNVCKGKGNVSNIKRHEYSAYITTCEECGEEFTTTPAATRGRFCSRKCWGEWMSKNLTGPDHPMWEGGHIAYYGQTWSAVRRFVRERDGVCMDCGISPDKLSRALDVHHIIPFRVFGVERHEEANDPSNLVALCNVCHKRREHADSKRDKQLRLLLR